MGYPNTDGRHLANTIERRQRFVLLLPYYSNVFGIRNMHTRTRRKSSQQHF